MLKPQRGARETERGRKTEMGSIKYATKTTVQGAQWVGNGRMC